MRRMTAIFGISGICLLILSIGLTISTREFVGSSLLAEGTVLRVDRQYYKRSTPEGGEGAGMRYVYVVWFPTRSGKTVAIQRTTGDATPYFRRGDVIPIRYNAEAPRRSARIATFGSLWGNSLFAAIAGAACLVFAAGFAVGRRHAGHYRS